VVKDSYHPLPVVAREAPRNFRGEDCKSWDVECGKYGSKGVVVYGSVDRRLWEVDYRMYNDQNKTEQALRLPG